MILLLSAIAIFVVSFLLQMIVYILLVAKRIIKKKPYNKVLRLVFAYSLVLTLVYIFQYIFI